MSLPITYIRSSSFATHEMCPMKYFAEYVLGWTGETGKAAAQGTIVHKVMEVLAHIKLAEQQGKDYFIDDIAGKQTRDTLDIDQLLEVIYEHYTNDADHLIWGPAEFKKCKLWTTMALEFNKGQMNPLNQEIVIPEQHFDIEIKADWGKYTVIEEGIEVTKQLRLKGTIDLITKVNDTTNEIIDYKSGIRKNWGTGEVKEYGDFYKDFQLRLYHYAHTVLFPNVQNVLITIYYIKDGGPFTIAFGRSDIPETLDMIREKFEAIRDTETPQVNYGPPCKTFCHLGKQTFEGTNVRPIVAGSNCKLSYTGNNMCMCDQLKYSLEHRNTEIVIDNMTKDGHNVGFYKAPGEIKG